MRLWLLAAIVGVFAAGATICFRWASQQIEQVATGHMGSLVAAARSISPLHRVIVGTVGGLLAGLALALGFIWARRAGASEFQLDYIEAAREGRVDLNDRVTFARTVSALFSVGTGASIGREGPMVQLAAWLATLLARWMPLAAEERKTLLVCGIAAGIGAAYHAPVAGVVFVLELALGFFAAPTVAPVLIAAATSNAIIYWMVEPRPIYRLPELALLPNSVGVALVAGLVFGVLGWALLMLLEASHKAFARVRSLPLRLGIGGLLVGAISAAAPQVWGNGYSVVQSVLAGTAQTAATASAGEMLSMAGYGIAAVLLAKIAATALSSGSGAIGGVFTPSLFVGAVGGSVLAQAALAILPAAWIGDPRVLSLVGMAAVLTAVTNAPLMAIVMVLEMTNQFQLTLPTMLACGVAYAVSTQLGGRPIYGNPIEAHS